jgi:hypothetical protein
MKNKFIKKFGDIDTGNGDLTLEYRKRNFEASTAKIKGSFFVDDYIVRDKGYNDVETFDFSVTPESTYMNTQTKIQFSLEGGNTSAYSMSADGKLSVNVYQLNDKQNFATINAAVTQYENGSSFTENVSKKIEIWNRPAQVGDVVYYDGSYGSAEEYDEGGKTAVGVCCYVAPRNADGSINATFHNPEDKHMRIMVSKDNIEAQSDSESFALWQWGAMRSGSDSMSLYITNSDGTKEYLSLDGKTEIYDIPNLRNITQFGMTLENGNSTDYITNESFRDNSDLGLENDGFKPIAAEFLMGDGFAYNEQLIFQYERKLDNTLLLLAGESYKEGDMVNSGYAKTLRVIAHRNKIINHCYDGNPVNDTYIPLQPVSSHEDSSEIDLLAQIMTELRNWAKGSGQGQLGDKYWEKWSQLYFPAASACYAFEPKLTNSQEMLSGKFKKHNWFLPTVGLLGRLYWYLYRNDNGSLIIRTDSPFYTAIQKGAFTIISNLYTWSVSEMDDSQSAGFNFSNGQVTAGNKFYATQVRAVVSF